MSASNHQREQWGSRLGFILAAMGSAVGLGNIWRFSYVTGEMGGGAFLIIYLVCILLIGVPILMAEFSIGKRSQLDVIGAFQQLSPGRPYVLVGFLGVASAFIILSFYGVIGGWSLHYFVQYLAGGPEAGASGGFEEYFGHFTSQPFTPLLWQFLFMAITVGIVYGGVKKGIEKSNKVLMPALALLVILLAGYSLTLGGTTEAMNFLFSPDWSAFGNPDVYLAAMGQAFFSLSLGMGAMITYGSYLSKKEKLPGAAASVATLDSLFAIVAGVMIFPAVFAFGIDPADGPGLVFITLPGIFDSLNFGVLFGLLFFFLLAAASITSGVSLLEVATAYFMRRFAWTRQKTALIIGGIIFLIGVPSSLGYGVLADITIAGNDILDAMDFIASNIFLPLGGLLIALFIGWGWNKAEALEASDFGDTFFGNLWMYLLRYFAPLAILIVFLNSIGLF